MIYAIVMAGGRGTRLKTSTEKPLYQLCNKPLINYVLDNLSSSKLVDEIIIATSPNDPKTRDYVKDKFTIFDTPGKDYVSDLSFILGHFEKKSKNDTILFINADLPFISADIIDYVLDYYSKNDKDALSILVPVKIFEDLNLNYEYEYKGLVPAGLNVLRSVNIIQDEEQLVLQKIELAFNINTLEDAQIAVDLNKMFKYNEIK